MTTPTPDTEVKAMEAAALALAEARAGGRMKGNREDIWHCFPKERVMADALAAITAYTASKEKEGAGDLREKLKAALPKNFYGWFGPHIREIILNAILPIITAHYTTPQAADAGLVEALRRFEITASVFLSSDDLPKDLYEAFRDDLKYLDSVRASSAKPVPGDVGAGKITHEEACRVADEAKHPILDMLKKADSCLETFDKTGASLHLHAARLAVACLLSDQRGSFAEGVTATIKLVEQFGLERVDHAKEYPATICSMLIARIRSLTKGENNG